MTPCGIFHRPEGPRRPPPLPRGERARRSAGGDGRLGRRQPEHERLREAARVAAGRDPARVDPGGVQPLERASGGVERAGAVVDSEAADRVRDRGRDVHGDRGPGRRVERQRPERRPGGRGRPRDDVGDRPAAHRPRERVGAQQVVRPGVRPPRCRLHHVRLGPRDVGGAEELDAVLAEDAGVRGVELRGRDEVRLVPGTRGGRAAAGARAARPRVRPPLGPERAPARALRRAVAEGRIRRRGGRYAPAAQA
jgi:hypothetical protein